MAKADPLDTEIAKLVDDLHAALQRKHGGDFSYSINARGRIIACSNYVGGYRQTRKEK